MKKIVFVILAVFHISQAIGVSCDIYRTYYDGTHYESTKALLQAGICTCAPCTISGTSESDIVSSIRSCINGSSCLTAYIPDCIVSSTSVSAYYSCTNGASASSCSSNGAACPDKNNIVNNSANCAGTDAKGSYIGNETVVVSGTCVYHPAVIQYTFNNSFIC